MSKPQKTPSPGGLDSSRNKAIEIGADPGNFPADLPYDYAGGFPKGTPGQGGTYRPNVNPSAPEAMPPQPKPFK